MAKFFDEEGNEVTGFSQEELDAKVVEGITAKEADIRKAAVEEYTKNNPPKSDDTLVARLQKLEDDNKSMRISSFATRFAGADVEKQTAFKTKFDRLTGYEETEAGWSERATDAAKLAFGEAAGINIGDVAGAGGRNPDNVKQVAQTEADKQIQSVLGISAEDVTKYGNKQ